MLGMVHRTSDMYEKRLMVNSLTDVLRSSVRHRTTVGLAQDSNPPQEQLRNLRVQQTP